MFQEIDHNRGEIGLYLFEVCPLKAKARDVLAPKEVPATIPLFVYNFDHKLSLCHGTAIPDASPFA